MGGYNSKEELKLQKFKERNTKKIGIIIFTITCVLLITGVFFYTSFASFESKETYNIMEGTVNDPGDIYFAYYIDGVFSENLPKQNTEYTLDTNASTCTNGVVPNWDYSTWEFRGNFSNYQETNKRTKCDLYFIKNKTVKTALGELSVYPYIPDFTKSACDDEICESHEKGIYETIDEDGTSYYYHGSVENNYLEFAGYYWRVVRINGDGTIRIIYDGTKAHKNGESSTDRQIGISNFNSSNLRNEYAGYMYTLDEAHGLSESSEITKAIDVFYETHLINYSEYIDTNAGFCGERSTLSAAGTGTGTVTTYYTGYLRMVRSTPSLLCENAIDLYTHTSSNKGNKALTYPIGLITMDEVMLAGTGGGIFNGAANYMPSSTNSYLATANAFWTMTPIGGYNSVYSDTWDTRVFFVDGYGALDDNVSTTTYDIRPTINLKADIRFIGNGTINNPYRLSVN